MQQPTRFVEWIVWGSLGLVIVGISAAFVGSRPGSAGAKSKSPLPVLGSVSPFTLTNQTGVVVSHADLSGFLWVADIIFTRCAGPCLGMTTEMAALQEALADNPRVKFLSLTADPEFDEPHVLQRYADKFGADPDRWHFLTGPKIELYRLATRGLLLAVDEIPESARETPEDLFIHSTKFVLIDDAGRLRGVFEGTDQESRGRILMAIRSLSENGAK